MTCLLQSAPQRIMSDFVQKIRCDCLAVFSKDIHTWRNGATWCILRLLLRLKTMKTLDGRNAERFLASICLFDIDDFFDVSTFDYTFAS